MNQMPSEGRLGGIRESVAALLSRLSRNGQNPDKARRRGGLYGAAEPYRFEINLQSK